MISVIPGQHWRGHKVALFEYVAGSPSTDWICRDCDALGFENSEREAVACALYHNQYTATKAQEDEQKQLFDQLSPGTKKLLADKFVPEPAPRTNVRSA